MVRTKLAAAIVGAGMFLPGLAAALGIGDYSLNSYLNQPLDLEIELTQVQDLTAEEILAAMASQADFDRAGIDRNYFLSDVRFEIVQRDGRTYVSAKSRQPVNEPFMNFLLEVQWPTGRILREYTILLDPPVYKVGAAPAATIQPVARAESPEVAGTPLSQPQPTVRPVLTEMADLPPPPSAVARVIQQQGATTSLTESEPGLGEYRVQAGETMGVIASRHRQAGTSVQQTMIAIQRANPDAFINGNVNLVRRGHVLRMPTQEEVARVDAGEARATIAEQNRAWRELLDTRGTARLADRAQVESTRSTSAAAPADKPTGAGQVTLVAPKAGAGKKDVASTGKDAEALRTKLTVAEEELEKAARANKELGSRLADLEKQVKSSDKLLSLKSKEISGLQAELNRLRKEKGLPPITEGAGEVAKDATDGAAGKEPAVPVETGSAEVAAKEPVERVAEEKPKKKEEKPKSKAEKEKPAKVVAEKPAPVEKKPSLLLLVGGLLAALGIGGGAFWYLRKRRQATAADGNYIDESHDQQVADDLAQLQDLHVAADEPEDFHHEESLTEAAAPESESTDPLGEADMYMAYGRFQQAADILYAALQRESNRDDLRVKLAEVYAEMGDTAAAQEHASKAADSRDAGIRAQAEAVLGRVGGAAAATISAAPAAEPSLDDLALEFSGGQQASQASTEQDDFSLDLEAELSAEAPATGVPAVEEELEFSLDDFQEPSSGQASAAPEELAEEFSLEDADLGDFTLQDEAAAPEQASGSEASADSLEDDLSLEPDGSLEVAPTDLELSEELADFTSEEEVVAEEPAVAGDLDLESELADLEADLSAEGVGSEAAAGGDDFDFLADNDENATKLDLARAYIEMGDAEGARDILNEVVADGTADQKMEARSLLEQAG